MPSRRQAFGAWAEEQAAQMLEARGWRIEARNLRSDLGELDIVAWDGPTLVFVEVKAFEAPEPGRHPAENVHPGKQRRLVRCARAYLAAFAAEPPCRFDAVTLMGGQEDGPRIEHFEGAFGA